MEDLPDRRSDPGRPVDPAVGGADPRRGAVPRPGADPRPGASVSVRIGTAGRGPGIAVGLIALFIAVALVKPWGVAAPAPRVLAPVIARPTPVATPDPLEPLRRNCQDPDGWRIYSRETWAASTVRAWRSFEPAAAATGPTDPNVPVIPIGGRVEALGYCSPWRGGEEAPPGSTVAAWRLVVDASSGGQAVAEPLEISAWDPGWPTLLGALYGPPSAGSGSSTAGGAPAAGGSPEAGRSHAGGGPLWAVGHYVFAIRGTGYARWWAVEISPLTGPDLAFTHGTGPLPSGDSSARPVNP